MRCDCGAFETCDVCIELAERDLGPYTAADYSRHYRMAVDPAAIGSKSESVVLATKFNELGQAVAMRILDGD